MRQQPCTTTTPVSGVSSPQTSLNGSFRQPSEKEGGSGVCKPNSVVWATKTTYRGPSRCVAALSRLGRAVVVEPNLRVREGRDPAGGQPRDDRAARRRSASRHVPTTSRSPCAARPSATPTGRRTAPRPPPIDEHPLRMLRRATRLFLGQQALQPGTLLVVGLPRPTRR